MSDSVEKQVSDSVEKQVSDSVEKQHDKCLRCRRALKRPKARVRGMGDICFRKWQAADVAAGKTLEGVGYSSQARQ